MATFGVIENGVVQGTFHSVDGAALHARAIGGEVFDRTGRILTDDDLAIVTCSNCRRRSRSFLDHCAHCGRKFA